MTENTIAACSIFIFLGLGLIFNALTAILREIRQQRSDILHAAIDYHELLKSHVIHHQQLETVLTDNSQKGNSAVSAETAEQWLERMHRKAKI